MSRVDRLRHEYVEFIPPELEPGVIYISNRFRTASHLCACGCGLKVVTPLNPAKWTLTDHGDTVSLDHSIGNWGWPCKSHYYITRGEIEWHGRMSDEQIRRVRQLDLIDTQILVGERKRRPQPRRGFIGRVLDGLARLFRR